MQLKKSHAKFAQQDSQVILITASNAIFNLGNTIVQYVIFGCQVKKNHIIVLNVDFVVLAVLINIDTAIAVGYVFLILSLTIMNV